MAFNGFEFEDRYESKALILKTVNNYSKTKPLFK